ncbi:MAG: Tad domain-containing protein [Anaerolineaceae bacterium]|nr:Tad domain-containing protein [Anaerolineaceae bacterium]
MMKNTNRFSKLEKAQVLPIVVVALFVIIAFAALIIDGGSIMLNRRTAQASADAGAMAGARQLCYPTGADPLDVARSYALMNGAATANAQLDNGLVSVNTTVTNNSFFAKIFNENSLDAGAEAVSGCFSPDGNFLLPIAWSCRPSLGNEGPFDPGLDCKMMALDWVGLIKPLVDGTTSKIEIPGNDGDYEMDGDNIVNVYTRNVPSQIYLIMDKIVVGEETYCKEDLDETDPNYAVAIKCDLDGDGKNDIEAGGNRGWLDLDNGGGGASDMIDWIINGLDFPVSPHTWRSGQTGTVTSDFESIKDYRVGEVVLVPVFNALCDDTNPTANPACMEAAHAYPNPEEPLTWDIDDVGSAPKFHIIAFDPFYISCVHTFSYDYCPGYALAQEVNPDPSNPGKSLIPDNIPSVEGFFLSNAGFPLDLEVNCNLNLGNCVVSLTK